MSYSVIKVSNISKRYRVGKYDKAETFAHQVKNTLLYPIRNMQRIAKLRNFNDSESDSIFWALRDVSFDVKQGEVLGIIGRNGAGKSTLLKILSKITEPTSGQISIKGKVASLLEVGTGFHPELTGRDNIYMNGTILGMTRREIERKLDEIIDFAGITSHIDTPVKFYSSGMTVRLGFSVAAHLEPEILIIDEVLAVGDFEFQKKCLGKMNDVASNGRTVLFVSHNMAAIQNLCPTSILLGNGQVLYKGDTIDAINTYLTDNIKINESQFIYGNGALTKNKKAIVKSIQLLNNVNARIESLLTGSKFRLQFSIDSNHEFEKVLLEIGIDTSQGERLAYFNNQTVDRNIQLKEGLNSTTLEIPKFPLLPGTYFVSYSLTINRELVESVDHAYSFQVESGDFYGTGQLSINEPSKILLEYSFIP